MKWINAGEQMPPNEFALPIICRRIGNNHSVLSVGEFYMRINQVNKINEEKIAKGQPIFEMDMTQFEWLDETPEGEEDVVWVIYDTLRSQFLDKGDFFRKELKYAQTYCNEAEAEKAKNYYIKIYSKTNRKETTEFLETIPVGLQKFLKRKLC